MAPCVTYPQEKNMHRLLSSFGPLLLVAMAAGCNNGSSLDHDSAVKVMNSALTGTNAAESRVMISNTSGAGQLDLTVINPAGTGSLHVVGSATDSSGVLTTTLDITFDHWHDAAADITLDGSLHEAGTFASPVPVSGNVKLTGALTASGEVNGTVDFDLTGSYSATGFSVKGDVGGQSLDITLNLSH
jgi:hypothetical protein